MQVEVGQCNAIDGNVGATIMNQHQEHKEKTLINDYSPGLKEPQPRSGGKERRRLQVQVAATISTTTQSSLLLLT